MKSGTPFMLQTTTPDHATWPASMLSLLERQQAMVEELMRLARSQAVLISEHRTEGLLDVLARRQTLIDEFTTSQNQLTQMTHRLDQRLSEAAPEQRTQIQSLIHSIGESLAKVMQTDEQDQLSLRDSRDHIKHELGNLSSAKQARHAYLGQKRVNARVSDRRG
jgi:hypothetical protein